MGINPVEGRSDPLRCTQGKGHFTPWICHQSYKSKTSLKSATETTLPIPAIHTDCICLSVCLLSVFAYFNFAYVLCVPPWNSFKRPSRRNKTKPALWYVELSGKQSVYPKIQGRTQSRGRASTLKGIWRRFKDYWGSEGREADSVERMQKSRQLQQFRG